MRLLLERFICNFIAIHKQLIPQLLFQQRIVLLHKLLMDVIPEDKATLVCSSYNDHRFVIKYHFLLFLFSKNVNFRVALKEDTQYEMLWILWTAHSKAGQM